jgi:FHA domain
MIAAGSLHSFFPSTSAGQGINFALLERSEFMARLLIKTAGVENRTLELRLGVNHVGRDPDCEFCIDHPTVSSLHCELSLTNDGVYIHDCNSTNGTFVNGEPVMEAWLNPGETVHLGDVELFVENTDAHVAIPKFERPRPKPPVVLADGAILCPRHPQEPATYRCTYCREVMCGSCVHIMRIKGGQPLFLCTICSHRCEPIVAAAPAKKKKGFLGFLADTVKLRFRHPSGSDAARK